MGLYELQLLDSHRNETYVNGQAAAVYKEHAPLVNASRAPGEWQTRHEEKLWLYDPRGEPTLFVQKLPIGNRCVRFADHEKPNGEWNTLDLICFEGDSIHVVNGEVVMRLHAAQRLDGLAPAPLMSGQISLQTEGAEIYYREVKLMPLRQVPAVYHPN